MSEENKSADGVEHIEQSPLTIGQRNYMKRTFNAHKKEIDDSLKAHRTEVGKIFESYSKEVAKGVSDNNSQTVALMNEALAKVDKKFSGMYSVLINKFLVKQEEKVFCAEVGLQDLLEITGRRLFALSSQQGVTELGDEAGRLKKFQEEFQKEIEGHMDVIANEMKEAAEVKARAQAEEQNAKKSEEVAPAQQEAQPAAASPNG